MTTNVRLEAVSKYYDNQSVLKDINLTLDKGKFYTLLGPSGCGKTTILNLIAGFTKADQGTIYINEEKVNDLPANKRNVNTVFQSYSLFPHMNVYDNIAFGLKIKGIKKPDIQQAVNEALTLVQLNGYEQRQVHELSGGQQQRVAIARALVNHPEVLLLDEPLSALDMKLRKAMQVELRALQQSLGITFVFVTHDQEEALAMSDWIFVMKEGEIIQSGNPMDIYDEPINRYVADFIGESNILPARMQADYLVHFSGRDFTCVDAGIPNGEAVEVVVRPEDIQIVKLEHGHITAIVDTILYRGVFNEIIAHDDQGFAWKIHTTQTFHEKEMIHLAVQPSDIHVMRFNESEEDFDARLEQYGVADEN